MSDLDAAFAVCRFVHDAAVILVFGTGVFVALLAPAALRDDLVRRLGPTLAAGALFACFGVLLWLPLQTAQIFGNWIRAFDVSALIRVAQQISSGRVWQARVLLTFALVVAAARPARIRVASVTLLSGLLLVSLAFVGHAASRGGAIGILERLNQVLHLLAGGAWLGALIPLLLCLGMLSDPARARNAVTALRRFSVAGHAAVVLVVATGLINVALILGRIPTVWTSPYQALLAAKILAVTGMTGQAVVNRYLLVPKMKRGGARAIQAIRAGSLAEIVLGAITLALVSVFGVLEPS
ncbi:copper homeostasis membrane protein CopD [Roseomonas sp. E05]|uniref:copper homeostasis membrane protein CopD n=1 Tax=Roseomonas sp. E05 TaxID=3046310 RepID=UPI0024B895D5|nr:copper homeostasis membrane protein CopD [Roseomonas sp. E05]MDJ0390953.1 copper homeostasis membrane protein CopD [Roseomonas sp. E05]